MKTWPLLAISEHAVDCRKVIRPLLEERRIECHGAKMQKGERRLDAKMK